MTFAVPALLWLLPLALSPLWFHLFMGRRHQVRRFPSLMFFRVAVPRLHTRRRIFEWLILFLRCLALAWVFLALARPFRPGAGAAGMPFVLIDNAASMGVRDRDGRSRLSRAVETARLLIESADHAWCGLVLSVEDPDLPVSEVLTRDRSSVLDLLERLRPTHAAGDPERALRRAFAMVGAAGIDAADLHVFTDGVAPGWTLPDRDAADRPSGLRLVLHRLRGADDAPDPVLQLEGVTLPVLRPVSGRPWRIEARLRNAGRGPAEAVLYAGIDGTDASVRQPVRIEGGMHKSVAVGLTLPAAGPARVQVRLEGPAAHPAAQIWRSIPVVAGDPVLLVGPPADFGRLQAALSPGGSPALSGLDARIVDLAELPAAISVHSPRLIATPWRHLSEAAFRERVRQSTEAGAALLVFPDAVEDGPAFALPVWSGVAGAVPFQPDAAQPVTTAAPDDPVWHDLHDAAGRLHLPDIRLFRAFSLQPAGSQTRVLLAASGGEPILTAADFGRGRVYVSGIGWDASWSSLPQRAAFLALVQAMARRAHDDDPAWRLRAGETARFRAALAAVCGPDDVLRLQALAGDDLRWEGAVRQAAAPARAGLYRVETDARSIKFAVDGDPRAIGSPQEGFRGAMSDDRWFDQHVESNHPLQTAAILQAAQRDRPLAGLLWMAALAAALAETWLANRSLAPVRPVTGRGAT